jgi:hypothetical protein
MALVCSAIAAVANVTAPETSKLCAQTLGPALNSVSLNELPFPVNPILQKSINPDRLIYSEPGLAPSGAGPKPTAPEIPPSVSAYTGRDGDQAPPPGFGQPPAVAPGPSAPDHPPSLPDLLLPAEGTPPP